MSRFARIAALTCPIAALLALGGCPTTSTTTTTTTTGTGTGTGTGTTDTSDIQSFLPSSVSLDVSEVSAVQSARTPADGYRGIVRGSADIVEMFQNAGDIVVSIGQQITDDLTARTQSQVSGELTINSTTVSYKCDFGAFDFDGDGTLDGSGNSQTVPVAFRIWTDRGSGFVQLMCGLVTVLPRSGNLGAGTLVARPVNGDGSAPADQQLLIQWDRTDSAHKWNLAYVSGSVDQSLQVKADIAYTRVDLRENGSGVTEKTVRASADFQQHPNGYTSMQSAVHYQRQSTALLLSAQSTGGTDTTTASNLCLNFADFSDLSGAACLSFDTQDMSYLPLPVGGENAFPAGFTESPTF